ncbi:MAG: 16S rRNA (cytosine(1402)-N(4))-methyltransferase RsmH [Acidobacteria bacterium]|nr:16S rRNA (cytosine(1402)-N(4))-methyltransferase RsmH [Acidobacteriota bacterium]
MLLAEAVEFLSPTPEGCYVDCTLGLGGHTAALLEAGAGHVIGIDRDQDALAIARERLAGFGDRVTYVHADYREVVRVVRETGRAAVDGVLADFGVSSMQLDAPERGFSFRQDGPLDMRMNRAAGPSLAELLATVDETTLANVIYEFGEERKSRRVARAIVEARDSGALTGTAALASVVRRAAGGGTWQRLDPATRTFQALRIWTNAELDGIDAFLEAAVRLVAPGGRVVVIAFHSLEDRVVKHTFRRLGADEPGTVRVVTRRPVVPSGEEAERNPRARSARLRVVERVA